MADSHIKVPAGRAESAKPAAGTGGVKAVSTNFGPPQRIQKTVVTPFSNSMSSTSEAVDSTQEYERMTKDYERLSGHVVPLTLFAAGMNLYFVQ